MFRRSSSCHQHFTTPPPPPPRGSEGQKATVVAPLSRPATPNHLPACTRGSRRRHTRPDQDARADRPSGLLLPLPGPRWLDPRVSDSVGRARFLALRRVAVRSSQGGFLPRSLPDLTQQIAVC